MSREEFNKARLIMTGASILLILAGLVQIVQDDEAYMSLYGRHMTLEELTENKVCTITPSIGEPYKRIVRAKEPCLNRTMVEMFQSMNYGNEYEELEFNHPSWKKNGSPLTSRPLTVGGNTTSASQ